MAFDPITAVLDIAGKVIDKIFPDPTAAAEAKAKLIELQINGDLQTTLGQLEINKIEAASESFFKSGWRPAVGWACTIGFIYSTILQPILQWVSASYGIPIPPIPDTGVLISTLFGMLGIGGLRTYEKTMGITK